MQLTTLKHKRFWMFDDEKLRSVYQAVALYHATGKFRIQLRNKEN